MVKGVEKKAGFFLYRALWEGSSRRQVGSWKGKYIASRQKARAKKKWAYKVGSYHMEELSARSSDIDIISIWRTQRLGY